MLALRQLALSSRSDLLVDQHFHHINILGHENLCIFKNFKYLKKIENSIDINFNYWSKLYETHYAPLMDEEIKSTSNEIY